MDIAGAYLDYISTVRRYSDRTCAIYRDVLRDYRDFIRSAGLAAEKEVLDAGDLSQGNIRSYEVWMMNDRKMSSRTVNLHLSVISGFCRYLVKHGFMESNPAALVMRPKMPKRLPDFYRSSAMENYFRDTAYYASDEALESFRLAVEEGVGSKAGAEELYRRISGRAIVSVLYSLGIRRSELAGMEIGNLDFRRMVATICGKGDKMREIPFTTVFSKEISLYLQTAEVLIRRKRSLTEKVFITMKGAPLYPEYVDHAVKAELGGRKDISGRVSAHVLRHSLATELLSEGAGLNSIKEMLGHSSLAATQIYTHNTISQIKTIYQSAHPRAKNGGKYGD